jgi:hypothetical protein
VYREKLKPVRKKWKMTLSFNVQFNGSAINLLVLAMKRLSVQANDNEFVAVPGPDVISYSTVTNYLRQRNFPSTLCENLDEPLHGIHSGFP